MRLGALAFGLILLGAGLLGPQPAFAQAKYPERPIRLIVPSAPGGVADAVGRHWADRMKALLGPVVVENQGGAGGLVGGAAVARASPDGYNILLGSAGVLIVIPIASHASHDLARDLTPISILGVVPVGFVVHPSLPAHNLEELVHYAKANPGKLSYGSSGAGTMTHLAGELFKSLTGTGDIVHVPYKGAGQSVADLISGHVPLVSLNVSGHVIALHRSGNVRLLAVTTPARLIAAPDVPTGIEAGVPNMVALNFYGLFAPAGTPKAIVEQVAQATGRGMADDEFRQKLVASGFEPSLDSSPEAAQRFVDGEIGRWRPVIKAIGLKLE